MEEVLHQVGVIADGLNCFSNTLSDFRTRGLEQMGIIFMNNAPVGTAAALTPPVREN
jgi:hypothetical protein